MKPLIIIPTYIRKNSELKVLQKCLSTCWESCDAEILMVDDASPIGRGTMDSILGWAKSYTNEVSLTHREINEGFSKTVNVGLAKALAEGRDACLVNSDIEFAEKGWLEQAQKTEADVVGALLLYPNLLIQHAGIYFSLITRSFDHRFKGCAPNLPAAQKEIECPVTGALQFIRHKVLVDVGIYDEAFRMGFEDVDFMIRSIKSGYKSVYNPKIKAIHHESLFRKGKAKSLKIAGWENDSFFTLIKKHKDVDLKGVAPTMFEHAF